MAETLRDVAGAVQAHCSLAPYLLARRWVLDAYRTAGTRRGGGGWSFLRKEDTLMVSDQKTGTATLAGPTSRLVTGVTLTFAQTDVNRQIRFNFQTSRPPFTIHAVDLATNTATLDRATGFPAGTGDTVILDAYMTMPEDFAKFQDVLSPQNGYRLRTWITEAELNAWDARRQNSGQPWCVASYRPCDTPGLEGRQRYELYPYQTSQAAFPYFYYSFAVPPSDQSTFQGPLRQRTDILLYGALAKAAGWPGDGERRNTFFNPNVALGYERLFNSELDRVEVKDEDIYPTWIPQINEMNLPYYPVDAAWLQSHGTEVIGLGSWGLGGWW